MIDDDSSFGDTIRAFVQEHLPPDIRAAVRAGHPIARERSIAWNEILAGAGYLVPHWPEEWGGRGWSVAQQLAFDEVLCTEDAPELNAVTFDMIGPVLVRYGSPAQRTRFLPAIASGRQWWCQGYSEPNAGSDLASLATRAVRDGDDYLVTGSKIWTSYAQYADWMFCLVRTSHESRPQEGISFLLLDMRSPGVTVRPIVGIHGWVVFNEVFLDGVRVPVSQRVGEENQGWTIAKALLEFERLKLARIGENKRRRARLLAIAEPRGLTQAPWFRERFATLEARLLTLEAHAARFLARAQAGERIGAEVSMLKLRGSQLIQLWEELTVEALGPEAWALDERAFGGAPLEAEDSQALHQAIGGTASSRRFLSRGYTIAGGSSEIQHNILGKQVLGL
ncbi:acyl-CoA dehydrogenase family protein [Pseudacidovorax sp. RU35E]|uniref:acyl-CoA dehydrogenase family protein n=1 Tax=Pseudacidovorax sp. RU35E TaxID=1907403 RepID=UPI000953DB54|nr:acyl-CoA dehydrogenase family protein [Pseudacidovorax sp. RU35E]SIR30124.1 acyl-CoA dehydrogenase [Pseudacidovorax sp. RU35E]